MNPFETIEENGKKFITIRGHKIEIRSSEECAKAEASVHMRVKDMPEAPTTSKIIQCVRCHEDIWIADSTPRGPKTFCMQCIVKEADEQNVTE